MRELDITASLTGFRTFRTLPSELRERGGEESMEQRKGENTKQSEVASVRNVRIEQEPWLPPDQTAWLPVARQILDGEFDGCDRSTRESLSIGLRAVAHPLCRRALERLQWKPNTGTTREAASE